MENGNIRVGGHWDKINMNNIMGFQMNKSNMKNDIGHFNVFQEPDDITALVSISQQL